MLAAYLSNGSCDVVRKHYGAVSLAVQKGLDSLLVPSTFKNVTINC